MIPQSSTWTEERLRQLITDKVEESLQLEYKGANALGKQNNQKAEITKDVSAMANSVGGTLIYGIAEHQDPKLEHLPEKLDPFPRNEFSREWLEQIIHTIQPRIEGVTIHSLVDVSDSQKGYFVVQIPQSSTAHQARDHRYYKRFNFMAVSMEDYEIRDVMNRRKHPQLVPKALLSVVVDSGRIHIGIKIDIKNDGSSSAEGTFVKVGAFFGRRFTLNESQEWQKRGHSDGGFVCRIAIHPGEEIPFMHNVASQGGYESLDDLPNEIRCTFRIYSRNAPALHSQVSFNREELKLALDNRKQPSKNGLQIPFAE
jgi:Putative DNA-binding domain